MTYWNHRFRSFPNVGISLTILGHKMPLWFLPWTNNFIHVCLSICETWKRLTHSPHFSPTRMSQELISYSSYWEVARKKSQGSCLAFWNKANGSLCSLGWLRLRINKSTFQEVFSWRFIWIQVTLCLSFPGPSLEWIGWSLHHLGWDWFVKWREKQRTVNSCWSVCGCLLTECGLVTDRHAPAHVPALRFRWQRFGCRDKTKWIEWRMTLSQAFLDLWLICAWVKSLNWHTRLFKFTSVELFCRFYCFKCYLLEAALRSLLGRWSSFSLKVPNALDICL